MEKVREGREERRTEKREREKIADIYWMFAYMQAKLLPDPGTGSTQGLNPCLLCFLH